MVGENARIGKTAEEGETRIARDPLVVRPVGDRVGVGVTAEENEPEIRPGVLRQERPPPRITRGTHLSRGWHPCRARLLIHETQSFQAPQAHRPYALGVAGEVSARFRWYLRWNRSTRPSLSISFWRPVNKGWHLEQISTLRTGVVERV